MKVRRTKRFRNQTQKELGLLLRSLEGFKVYFDKFNDRTKLIKKLRWASWKLDLEDYGPNNINISTIQNLPLEDLQSIFDFIIGDLKHEIKILSEEEQEIF